MFRIGAGDLLEKIVFWTARPYNSIIVGVPYFILGRYFARNDIHLTRWSKLLGVLSFILLFTEIFVTYKLKLQAASDCYLMLLPCACFVFVFIKDINFNLKFNPVILRNASTIIFFSHFIFIFAIEIVEKLLNISFNPLLRFPIVSLLSLILTFVLIKLRENRRFYWVKYLY